MFLTTAEDIGVLQNAFVLGGVTIAHEWHEAHVAHGGKANLGWPKNAKFNSTAEALQTNLWLNEAHNKKSYEQSQASCKNCPNVLMALFFSHARPRRLRNGIKFVIQPTVGKAKATTQKNAAVLAYRATLLPTGTGL